MKALTAVLLVASLCIAVFGQVAYSQSWEFNTNGDREGWTTNNGITSWQVQGGILYIDPASGDFYIERTGVTFSASGYNAIRIRMASNATDGQGQIFFRTTDSDFWSEDKSVWFAVNNGPSPNAAYYEYTVFLGHKQAWQGTITGIRIDPAQNGQPGNGDTVGIDYIRLVSVSFSIDSAYATPYSVKPGDTITVTYNVTAGARASIVLGASIRPNSGGADLSDPPNDTIVYAYEGSNTFTRQFVVPATAASGTYQLVVGLVADLNANGVIEPGDRYLAWKEVNNALQISPLVVSARIDGYSPSDPNNPVVVHVGNAVTISVTFSNTGTTAWNFIAGATVWDSSGNVVADYERFDVLLNAGQQATVNWSHTVNQVGDYWVQFGVWKSTPYIQENLLDKEPSPSQRLIQGVAGGSKPIPDIKANGLDGPVTIPYGSSVTISWTSTNAASCSISPTGWAGTSGAQSIEITTDRTFTITCSGPGGQGTDSVTVRVSEEADLSVSIFASPDHLPVQHDLTYTVTITNNGPSTATNVTLEDRWTSANVHVDFITLSSAQGICTSNLYGDGIHCEYETIPSGGRVSVSAVVRPNVKGLLSNSATVQATSTDPNTANNTAAVETMVTNIPVIFVPGIKGSELYRIDVRPDRIWPDVMCNPGDLSQYDDLMLNNQGTGPLNREVQIQVADIIREACGRVNIYIEIIELLESMGYQEPWYEGYKMPLPYPFNTQWAFSRPGDDLFVFPYDWRKDLREIAGYFSEAIQWVMDVTNSTKVDIIAHSMGGLIARYCINRLTGCSEATRKLITLASPQHGSVNAYVALNMEIGECLEFWKIQWCGIIPLDVSRRFASNLPATYQLLPTKKFFSLATTGNYLLRSEFHDPKGPLLGIDATYQGSHPDSQLSNAYLVRRALEFHRDLGDSLGSPEHPFNGDAFIFVGSGHITKLHLISRLRPNVEPLVGWDVEPTDGDGVVPVTSAALLNVTGGGEKCILYVNRTHLAIVQRFPGLFTHRTEVFDAIQMILADDANCSQVKESVDGIFSAPLGLRGNWSMYTLRSPAVLRVFDVDNNLIGPDVNSGLIEQAPGNQYFMLGENTMVLLDETRGPYRVELEATARGDFILTHIRYDGNQEISRVEYGLVPITEHSTAMLTYDPASVTPPSLQLDYDGNGTIDQVIQPGACAGVTAISTPPTIKYGPTSRASSRRTIRVVITNESAEPVRVMAIAPQLNQPFSIRKITPALSTAGVIILPGRRQVFQVVTQRAAGSSTATAVAPYFDIDLDCGVLRTASDTRLLIPLRPEAIQVLVQAGQLHVEAYGLGIQSVHLQIYDLGGRLLLEQREDGSTLTIPIAEGRPLANGVYLYVVRLQGLRGEEYVSELRKLVILR